MEFLTRCLALIGMDFGSLSFWLWFVAVLAFAFMLRSVYSALSWLWRLPERMPKIKGSTLLKPGEQERFLEPPRKLTARQIGTAMLVLAAVLGAYDIGTKTKYSREYADWKQRSEITQKAWASWLKDHPDFYVRTK